MIENAKEKKICILGTGYVGLTLGLTLADIGYQVIGVEKDSKVIMDLRAGRPHFFERGLEDILKRELDKNFKLVDSPGGVCADVYIISVGTPIKEDKKPNFEFIKAVSYDIGLVLKKGDIVILRSTVPPGTTRNVVGPILEAVSGLKLGEDIYLAFAPERTIEGKALEELRYLPQIIGGLDRESTFLAANIFDTITKQTVVVGSLEAAEMVKLIDNTYRDIIFATANLFALTCDKFNLDTHEIINAANFGYPRGGIPLPSPGVGGSCLYKDPHLFFDSAAQYGLQADFVKMSRSINESMPYHVASKVIDFFKKVRSEDIRDKKIFILGLAFKGCPETSDIRTSPSVDVIMELGKYGANIFAYDAVVRSEDTRHLNITFCGLDQGFYGADAVIIMNNHLNFRDLDIPKYFNDLSKTVLFFDCWKLHLPEKIMRIKNLKYGNLGFSNF